MSDLVLPHRPILAPGVEIIQEHDGVLLNGSLRRCKLPGDLGDVFGRMRDWLNGDVSSEQVCNAFGEEYEPSDIAALLSQLYRDNFIREGSQEREGLSGIEFYTLLRDWITERALESVNKVSYTTDLINGRWTKRMFTGFALELYHFFTAVFDHSSTAVASARHPEIKRVWVQFLYEEHSHPKLMAACAEALGVPRSQVFLSRPLPTTQARISHLTNLARSEPLAYAAVVAYIESTAGDSRSNDDGTESDRFIKMLREQYDLPPLYIENVMKHRVENVVGDHSNVGLSVFKHVPFIDDATQKRIIASVEESMEVEEQYITGLHSYYTNEANPIPYGVGLPSR